MLIGESQTISAPHIHAQMLELLSPHLPEGGQALDVGAGRPSLSIVMFGCFHWGPCLPEEFTHLHQR